MTQRIQLPKESRNKLEFHEKEFAEGLYEHFNLPVDVLDYHPDEDWIELSEVIWWNEEAVIQFYESFEPDPTYGKPQWQRRLIELLDQGELSEEEEKELKKLERKHLRRSLG